MKDKLYTVVETGKMLKIGKNRVYNLIKEGYLEALNLGGLKIRDSSIENFLDQYEGYDLTDLKNIKKMQ